MSLRQYVDSYIEALNSQSFMDHQHQTQDEVLIECSILLRSCCGDDRDAFEVISCRLLALARYLHDDICPSTLKVRMLDHAMSVLMEAMCNTAHVGLA